MPELKIRPKSQVSLEIEKSTQENEVYVSAKTGENIEALKRSCYVSSIKKKKS